MGRGLAFLGAWAVPARVARYGLCDFGMGELSIGAATPEGLEAVFTTAPPAGKISHGPWVALSFLRRTLSC